MFSKWKRPWKARGVDDAHARDSAPEPRGGGVGGAGPAIAGPAEATPPPRDAARGRRRRFDADQRARLLAEFDVSSLSAREFAERHGIGVSTLSTWRRAAKKAEAHPAGKLRRFSPDERRAAVEAFHKSGRKRRDFARLWGCSVSSLEKWLRRYAAEGPKGLEDKPHPKGRRSHHPSRLSDAVRAEIVAVRKANSDFGVNRVASHLARFSGIKVSPSSVRNVLRDAGIAPQAGPSKKRKPKKKPPRRFERACPGELWQSDITSFVLRRQGRRVYLTVFLDDHSRYVVAWSLATHQRTPLVTEPLLEAIARYGKPREVLTDQGRQYFAWRGKSGFQKLLAKEGIQHVVSRAHHPETLGKCERLWKTVQDEFWDRAAPQDLEDARRRLARSHHE